MDKRIEPKVFTNLNELWEILDDGKWGRLGQLKRRNRMKRFNTFVLAVAFISALFACSSSGKGTPSITTPVALIVSSTSPASLVTGVTLTATIGATFNNPLNALTMTGATFLVSKGTNTISGTVVVSGVTATFTPTAVLAPSTIYTAMVTTSVKDSAGTALATAATWTFRTKPAITSVKRSNYSSSALDSDGNVWTWGDDSATGLGRTPAANQNNVPGKVSISNVITIAMAGDATAFVAAAKSDGTVWTWGLYKGLGTGSTNNSDTPVQATMTLPAGVTVTSLAAGRDHVLALRSDGIVMSWGDNYYGQIGDNSTAMRLTPYQVPLTDVKAISAGYGTSWAIKNDGTVWAWGYNQDAEFGLNNGADTTNKLTPVAVTWLDGALSLSAGGRYTTAIKSDGTVWEFGTDYAKGEGVCNPYPSSGWTGVFWPLQIKDSAGTSNLTLAAPASVISSRWGNNYTLALKNDGTLLGWGYGSEQLGIGTPAGTTCGSTDHYELLPIPAAIGVDHVIAVEAGPDGGIAVKNDGTVWVWGGNTNNALGVNTGGTLPVLTPMQVPGLP